MMLPIKVVCFFFPKVIDIKCHTVESNASFILSMLYSFLIELSAQFIGKSAQKKIELPFEQTSMCD